MWGHIPLIPGPGSQGKVEFLVQGQPRLQRKIQGSQGYTEKLCLQTKGNKKIQCHIHFCHIKYNEERWQMVLV